IAIANLFSMFLSCSIFLGIYPLYILIFRYSFHIVLPSFPTRRSSDLPRHRGSQPPKGNSMKTRTPVCLALALGVTLACMDHAHRSEEHTSELQSRENLVCRRLLEKINKNYI